MSEDAEGFRRRCVAVSKKFSIADKRKVAVANLVKANLALKQNGRREFKHLDKVWRRCLFPGVPCHCRLLLAEEDEYTDGAKKLTPFCTELKCDLTEKRQSHI